jgi:HD superfamily phosphohydrolase
MDYLRRDAYFCGVSVAFDAAHLVRSLDLSFQDGRFVIAVERNAIFALEQLLLARKQMFSQVYQNRVNLLLDDLLSRSVDRIHECGKLSVPRTVSEFVRLDDIWMIQCMKELVADNVVAGTAERVSDLALKMYLTRSLPVTLETREIRAEEWEQTRKLMQRTYPRGTLLCTPAKKLLEQEVRSLAALGSRTPRRKNPDMPQPTGVLYTQEHKGKPMVAVAQVSELIRSTAWKIPTFRVIVTKTLAESAKERGLEDKLLTMVWPTSTKAQGEDNANTLQNTRHSHSPKAESMGASSASRRLRVIASARQRTSR